MKGKSLRVRMILYTFLTTGFALLLSGIGLMLYDIRSLGADLKADLLTKVDMMNVTTAEIFSLEDEDAAKSAAASFVQAMGKGKHIQNAAIFREDGQVLASYSRQGKTIEYPGNTYVKRVVNSLPDGETEVYDPVLVKGNHKGVIYISNSSQFITERRKRHILILVGILIVSLGVTMASSTWLQAGFVNPVKDLVQTANRVSLEKDFSLRATKWTEDELGQLTDAFNLMLEKVQRRDNDLQASENRLRQVIDLVPHMIFAKDRDGRFILCNKALADNFGSTVDKVLSSTHEEMHQMHKAEEARQMHEDDLKVIDSGIPLHLEETLTDNNGEVIYLKTTKIPYSQSGTQEDAMLGIAINITHEKMVENELREAHAELQTANNDLEQRVSERTAEVFQYQQKLIRQEKLATIGQVSGSIAHELRNPLGAIKQSIFFLNRYLTKHNLKDDHPKFGEHLKIMDEELKTSDHVITSLLDMSRVKKMERKEVEIQSMIEDLQTRCRILPPKQFKSEVSPAPLNIDADPVQLRQVLVNLVHNAKDATPPDGTIEVNAKLEEASRTIIITVSDNGSGIPKESLERIFEPLYTTKNKGTGLGLSICKQIIEEHHHGKMEVESTEGEGTSFIIHLPLDKPGPSA